jgi:hypothetical protein
MRARVLDPAAVIAPVLALACLLASSAALAAAPTAAEKAREQQMRAVVHEWSNRLNANDNAGVARLFALPAVVAQGSYALKLSTRKEIAEWHSGLPCSGKVVSITIHGLNAVAVFRLGDRGATKCDAPGTLAAARFMIVRGKIVLWEQVAVPQTKAPGSGLTA